MKSLYCALKKLQVDVRKYQNPGNAQLNTTQKKTQTTDFVPSPTTLRGQEMTSASYAAPSNTGKFAQGIHSCTFISC